MGRKIKLSSIIGIIYLLLGIIILLNSFSGITGFVIFEDVNVKWSSVLGVVFVLIGILIIMISQTLEVKVEELPSIRRTWTLYPINRDSILEDIEQGYLEIKESLPRTAAQSWAERHATLGRKLIEEKENLNKNSSYEEQFFEGHAEKGGRVIDVESHIAKSGKNKGKLIHFGQPANAIYLWIVDEDGNFIIANRHTMLHEMKNMDETKIDYSHRLHKLPHPTLARGRKVYGSGEVLIEGGLVKSFNTASGHYVDLKDIDTFNKQGENVFRYYMEKVSWKSVEKGAKYVIKKDK